MDEGIVSKPSGLAVGIALAAASATLASVSLPWITTGVGTDAVTYSGFQLPPAALPVSVAALTAAVLAMGSVWRSPALAPFAVIASGTAALLTAVTIMVTETAALMIPSSLLPETISRTALTLSAGYGIWLALVGSAIAAVAMHDRLSTSVARHIRFSRQEWRRMLALVGLATLTVLIAWLRYRTWIDASILEGHLNLPGWAAPWIGPLSLLAVWMLAGALALAAFYRDRIAGLIAATAGWLTSFLAALVILAVSSIGRLGLEDLAPASVDGYVPGFHTTEFVWITFLAGLGAAAVGAFLVSSPDRRGSGGVSWGS